MVSLDSQSIWEPYAGFSGDAGDRSLFLCHGDHFPPSVLEIAALPSDHSSELILLI
jgi:hypothetical protein